MFGADAILFVALAVGLLHLLGVVDERWMNPRSARPAHEHLEAERLPDLFVE